MSAVKLTTEARRLLGELRELTGESESEAMRRALAERVERCRRDAGLGLEFSGRMKRLARDVWPKLEADARERPLTKDEPPDSADPWA